MFLLFKTSLVKIKNSFGRFLSVVLIVALGTGFFAGLRGASPDMLKTLDNYYDKSLLMDYKITSTMGLTNDDIDSLNKLNHTSKVIPSYSLDVLVDGKCIRVHALETNINKVTLKDGRMPKKENECLGDANYFKLNDSPVFKKEKLSDYINISSCKVVGLIDSALYVGKDKGIANVGNGKLESFIFVLKDTFIMDYYTEAYIIAKDTIKTASYSDNYNNTINKLDKELQAVKPLQETKRYEEILKNATLEISEAKEKLNNEIKNYKKELNDTKIKLDDGLNEVNTGYNKINSSQNKLNNEKVNASNEFAASQNQISSTRNKIIKSLNDYGLTTDNLDNTINDLKTQLDSCQNNCEEIKTKYDDLILISNNIKKLDELQATLNRSKEKANTEFEQSQNIITRNKAKLDSTLKTINEGFDKYNSGIQELETKTEDANNKIKDAEDKLKTIEKPNWYLLNRTNNNGYTSFYEDASKVESIAKVFPIFFIVVAILMCLNTMTRLIEEERNEMGIFASLGYSKFKIVRGYIFYCFIASIIGVSIGLSVGYNLIPRIVYGIYDYNYILPDLIVTVKPVSFFLMLTYASILLIGVAIYVCMKELKTKPAILLRPKAPKMGKTVLLEKINFIWKHLSFTWKVTTRNIFRYKKRVFMTIIGIAGCTALLLTGFGLRDGINSIANLQYGKILKYDALISLNEETEVLPTSLETTFKENKITNPLLINQEAYTFNAKNKKHDVYVIAPKDSKDLKKYISLKSTVNNKTINLSDYGAVISAKMAKLLKVNIGDTINIRDSSNNLYMLYVADITENYALHYIYLNPSYLNEIKKEQTKYNMVLADMNNTSHDKVATNVLKNNNAIAINFSSDNIKAYDSIIEGMNKIVYLIIGASCLLALIVLYNLVIININERKREIATLKVLGFKDYEISTYVFRETIILTIIGITIGLLLGIVFHQYIIITAETDNIMFLKVIHFLSYIYSFLITIAAVIIIRLITYRPMKKIDMIESLKALDQ